MRSFSVLVRLWFIKIQCKVVTYAQIFYSSRNFGTLSNLGIKFVVMTESNAEERDKLTSVYLI